MYFTTHRMPLLIKLGKIDTSCEYRTSFSSILFFLPPSLSPYAPTSSVSLLLRLSFRPCFLPPSFLFFSSCFFFFSLYRSQDVKFLFCLCYKFLNFKIILLSYIVFSGQKFLPNSQEKVHLTKAQQGYNNIFCSSNYIVY